MNSAINSTQTKPPSAGKGRPKGSINKIHFEVKEMILTALNNVGGQEYLTRQAEENPTAFLSLLGKVIPRDIKTEISGVESILAERLQQARSRLSN